MAGYGDWRLLPNAKELQYIVDYTQSPETTGSSPFEPVFQPIATEGVKTKTSFLGPCTAITSLNSG
jgi:hypothetical protein